MERNALGPVILVEARATAMQINALLVQLTARQEAFPLVVVEPATGVAWQQGFGQYNRRGVPNMIGGQNNLNTQSNLNTQNAANTQNNFSNQFVQSGGSAGSGAVAKAEGFNYATSPQSGGVQPNAQAAPQAAPPAGPQTGQQAGPPPAAQYSPQGGLGYGGEPSPRQQEARTRPTKASGAVRSNRRTPAPRRAKPPMAPRRRRRRRCNNRAGSRRHRWWRTGCCSCCAVSSNRRRRPTRRCRCSNRRWPRPMPRQPPPRPPRSSRPRPPRRPPPRRPAPFPRSSFCYRQVFPTRAAADAVAGRL